MLKQISIFLLMVSVLIACGDSSNTNTGDDNGIPNELQGEGNTEVSDEAMDQIIQNFPAPVEMAALMESINVPYSQKYLFPTDVADDYNTSFKQAIGLGIYSTDLGYLNIYSKTSSIVQYITVIKRIADALKVGQFFDFPTLKRLATNNENLDSLMFLSVHSFNQMDDHLRMNNRSHLSALVVTGVWLEGLYLASQVYKDLPNAKIAERIGDQKLVLADIMVILKGYKKDKNFENLIVDLEILEKVYEDVKITIIPGKPEMVEQDGMLVIKQNEQSVVDISEEQISIITKKVEEVRNKLMSL